MKDADPQVYPEHELSQFNIPGYIQLATDVFGGKTQSQKTDFKEQLKKIVSNPTMALEFVKSVNQMISSKIRTVSDPQKIKNPTYQIKGMSSDEIELIMVKYHLNEPKQNVTTNKELIHIIKKTTSPDKYISLSFCDQKYTILIGKLKNPGINQPLREFLASKA